MSNPIYEGERGPLPQDSCADFSTQTTGAPFVPAADPWADPDSEPGSVPVAEATSSPDAGDDAAHDRRWAILGSALALSLGWLVASDAMEVSAIFFITGGVPLAVLAIAFLVTLVVLRGGISKVGLWGRVFLALSAALALVYAVCASTWVRTINAFALGASCVMAYRLVRLGEAPLAPTPSDLFRSIKCFFASQTRAIPWLRGLRRREGRLGASVAPVLGGLAAAAILLALVVPLLSAADSDFASIVDGLLSWNGGYHAVLDPLRLVLLFLVTTSLLLEVTRSLPAPGASANPAFASLGAVGPGVALAVLDFVYLVFVALQVGHLFGGAAEAAASGGYSHYAREGFFELVRVTAINLVVLGVVVSRGSSKGRALPGLELALVALTALILASAAWRMALYVGEYGLTVLRLLTIWGMVDIAFLLAIAAVRICRPTVPAFALGLSVTLGLWSAFGLMRPDAVIASYNVAGVEEGRLDAEDVDDYLAELSDDTLPYRERLRGESLSSDAESGIAGWPELSVPQIGRLVARGRTAGAADLGKGL